MLTPMGTLVTQVVIFVTTLVLWILINWSFRRFERRMDQHRAEFRDSVEAYVNSLKEIRAMGMTIRVQTPPIEGDEWKST